MRKLFCLIVFSMAIQCFSQSYETKFIDQSVVTINSESFVTLYDFKKIESNSSLLFHIKNGSLLISVSGIIDKASPQIMISLSAKETLDNEMVITASGDSQLVQYKIEGGGLGSYNGSLNGNDNYIINTGFKITAPGHPPYILVLPLNLHISRSGNNNSIRCFVDGTAYAYNAEKKKKGRNKKTIL
jgi:hypothetical protein